MRSRTRPSTPGNRARELQEKREKIARKSPTGLGAAADWAWRNGDSGTRAILRQAAEREAARTRKDLDAVREQHEALPGEKGVPRHIAPGAWAYRTRASAKPSEGT
jgi:hypothetical protein